MWRFGRCNPLHVTQLTLCKQALLSMGIQFKSGLEEKTIGNVMSTIENYHVVRMSNRFQAFNMNHVRKKMNNCVCWIRIGQWKCANNMFDYMLNDICFKNSPFFEILIRKIPHQVKYHPYNNWQIPNRCYLKMCKLNSPFDYTY